MIGLDFVSNRPERKAADGGRSVAMAIAATMARAVVWDMVCGGECPHGPTGGGKEARRLAYGGVKYNDAPPRSLWVRFSRRKGKPLQLRNTPHPRIRAPRTCSLCIPNPLPSLPTLWRQLVPKKMQPMAVDDLYMCIRDQRFKLVLETS